MRDVAATLKSVYNAHSAVLLPGSGTFAMEAGSDGHPSDACAFKRAHDIQ